MLGFTQSTGISAKERCSANIGLLQAKLSRVTSIRYVMSSEVIQTACLKIRERWFLPHSEFRFQRNTFFFSAHSIVERFRERDVACSAPDRQGSNIESKQCHVTILRRFSWPGLACVCTNNY